MTYREFLENVIANLTDASMVEYAKSELAKLDAKNASKRAKNADKALERAPIAEKVLAVLAVGRPLTIKEMCELDTSLVDVKGKLPTVLTKDLAEKVVVVVGKGKNPNAYTLAQSGGRQEIVALLIWGKLRRQ